MSQVANTGHQVASTSQHASRNAKFFFIIKKGVCWLRLPTKMTPSTSPIVIMKNGMAPAIRKGWQGKIFLCSRASLQQSMCGMRS
jgi:hypothetical protein